MKVLAPASWLALSSWPSSPLPATTLDSHYSCPGYGYQALEGCAKNEGKGFLQTGLLPALKYLLLYIIFPSS